MAEEYFSRINEWRWIITFLQTCPFLIFQTSIISILPPLPPPPCFKGQIQLRLTWGCVELRLGIWQFLCKFSPNCHKSSSPPKLEAWELLEAEKHVHSSSRWVQGWYLFCIYIVKTPTQPKITQPKLSLKQKRLCASPQSNSVSICQNLVFSWLTFIRRNIFVRGALSQVH